jgi:hypothetical protein
MPLLKAAPGIYIDPVERKEIAEEMQGREGDFVLLDAYGLKRLGLNKHNRKTLQRLYLAEMITMYRVSPARYLLKLSSWEQHLKRVAEDNSFWDRPQNKKKWRNACLAI